MKKIIYLSPSNHGKNQNKCLHSGCYEDKHCRKIAEACSKYLAMNGFVVIVARESLNMTARVNEANYNNADLYVPIHTNAFGDPGVRYLMFMFYRDSKVYREIFDAVSPALEAIYPGNSKAKFAKRADLFEINRPIAKTMYCELGFHTNSTDCDNFIHNYDMVGRALALGICNYYGVDFRDGKDKNAEIVKGAPINCQNVPLYRTSISKEPAGRVTGTYYLWDGVVIKDRVRITNLPSRVGKLGQVTGWVNVDDIKL